MPQTFSKAPLLNGGHDIMTGEGHKSVKNNECQYFIDISKGVITLAISCYLPRGEASFFSFLKKL